VELIMPFVWHIVGVCNDFFHQQFGIKNPIVFWNHTSCDGEDRSKNSKVKENRSMGRDLEIEEKVRIQDSGKEEYSSKGARDECDETKNDVN
jgi:hypothetical protein